MSAEGTGFESQFFEDQFKGAEAPDLHPFYQLPPPLLDPESPEADKEAVQIAIMQAAEANLLAIDEQSSTYTDTLRAQLEYAVALSKTPHTDHARAHIDLVVEQIEVGKASREKDQSFYDIEKERLLAQQTDWYLVCSVASHEAGFTDLAKSLYWRAEATQPLPEEDPEADLDFDQVRARGLLAYSSRLKFVRAATTVGLHDRAVELMTTDIPHKPHYAYMADFAAELKDALLTHNDSVNLACIDGVVRQIIEGIAEQADMDLSETSSGKINLASLETLIAKAGKLKTGFDVSTLLEKAQSILDDQDEDSEQHSTYERYYKLARMYGAAGMPQDADQILNGLFQRLYTARAEGRITSTGEIQLRYAKLGLARADIGDLVGCTATVGLVGEASKHELDLLEKYLKGDKYSQDPDMFLINAARLASLLVGRIKKRHNPTDAEKRVIWLVNLLGERKHYDAMRNIYDSIFAEQPSWLSHRRLSGATPDDYADLAIHFYQIDPEAAFDCLDLLNDQPKSAGKVICKILEDVSTNPSTYDDPDRLQEIASHISEYSRA